MKKVSIFQGIVALSTSLVVAGLGATPASSRADGNDKAAKVDVATVFPLKKGLKWEMQGTEASEYTPGMRATTIVREVKGEVTFDNTTCLELVETTNDFSAG